MDQATECFFPCRGKTKIVETHGERMANTWRTHGEHMANIWQTHGVEYQREAAKTSEPQLNIRNSRLHKFVFCIVP